MIARDRPYSELRDSLKGKKVLIWTCNTCARLCYEIGGKDSAERLGAALGKDGIDVIAVLDTNASCLEGKVRSKYDGELFGKTDVVVSITCNIGALCAKRAFGKEILNPIATLGAGFADSERTVFVTEDRDGSLSVRELSDIAKEKGLRCDPYA